MGVSLECGVKKKIVNEFRNLHPDKTCLVCGLGQSLNILTKKHQNQYITLGVNNIGQFNFHPDYLVIVDMIDSAEIESHKIKIQAIKDNKSPYTFSFLPIECTNSQVIRIKIDRNFNSKDLGSMLNRKAFPFRITSMTTCIAMAIYMGFKQVGIIGMDIEGHPIKKYLSFIDDYCQHLLSLGRDMGTELLNLSPNSLISTIPKCTIEEFDGWYGGKI